MDSATENFVVIYKEGLQLTYKLVKDVYQATFFENAEKAKGELMLVHAIHDNKNSFIGLQLTNESIRAIKNVDPKNYQFIEAEVLFGEKIEGVEEIV